MPTRKTPAGTTTLRQLAACALKPSSKGRPRNVWEFLVLRRSPYFDRAFYLRWNPDVADAGMHPLLHYLEHGAHAGLDPSPTFKTIRYLKHHPELSKSGVNPLYHFHRSTPRASRARARTEIPGLRPADESSRGGASAMGAKSARDRSKEIPFSVSVILPTHDRVLGLREALRSALDQSHVPHEVIVSDDGSTEDIGAMLAHECGAELEAGRLRYVRSEERRGSAHARNAGLEVANGELIAYLDSDNTWHRDYLLTMVAELAEREDVNTAYCGLNLQRDGDEPVKPVFEPYDRDLLLARNYIDLNVFVHRRRVYEQLGGFDETLTRLVDWELILRYTRRYPPSAVPHYLVDYDGGEQGGRITHTEDFAANAAAVRRRFAHERVYSQLAPLRIGYVLWDYPALSQTFVLREIRHLVEDGYDVRVYYHAEPDRAARLDFDVPADRVADADELAELLVAHERTIVHSHFAYPATTRLVWPAANAAGLPFTFMVHAVDIFHRANVERNRIAEVANDELCLRVFGVGEFHRSYLIEHGVPPEKISIARPAGSPAQAPREALDRRLARRRNVVTCITRFVEKKGVDDLIRAAARLGEGVDVRLYGYGPQEESLRAIAGELGAGNVRFAGVLNSAEAVANALAEADAFALPCVVDSNGDMDGLPTVIGEAMAAGVPVITTDVSAIPEVVQDGVTGFVVPSRDPEALARRITEVLAMDADSLGRVVSEAQRTARETWNVKRTADALLDCWERPPLDIALVTHSRDEPEGAATTLEIIRRLYELTTTHFNLTIVDNASDEEYREALCEAVRGRANTSLILLERNVHWGPALNLALGDARSEHLVYVCSKEGFVLKPGWEREYLDYMRSNRDVAMAGHLISSPAFPTGESYTRQPWFEGFRNKEFAERNPDREFFHVQGGLFALRRSAFESCGGFSDRAVQDAADVEYSFYLESLGWKLGEVPSIPSVTKKTRPRVTAHLDEGTVAAHPLTLESVELAAGVASGRSAYCNVCAWAGATFSSNGRSADECPACGSTPFGRLLFRYLAGSSLPFRRLACAAAVSDAAVLDELERMFELERIDPDEIRGMGAGHDVVIADLGELPAEALDGAVEAIGASISDDGLAIVGRPPSPAGSGSAGTLEDAFAEVGCVTQRVSRASRAVRFAPDGLVVVRRSIEASAST